MPSHADEIIDRRRLRRKLTFWRVAAIVIVAIAILAAASWFWDESAIGNDHIARLRVEGTITENEDLLEKLKNIRDSAAVKGVILTIDSPGGTTAGGEAIFEEVRRLAAEKPVVAQVGTLAASAGYMIASAADHIVARQSSIVGSIGVLVQFPDVTGLMDKIGVRMDGVKSSPLKAEPSPFNQTTEEERDMLRAMISDSYDWFVDLVTERRPLDRAQVLALADGRVFTGRQALKLKLVDELGGEYEAKDWLAGQGVDGDLEIVEWNPKDSAGWLLGSSSLVRLAARLIGLPDGGKSLLRDIGADSIFLDGLMSVWQPDLQPLAD